jgi:hypothetical protein
MAPCRDAQPPAGQDPAVGEQIGAARQRLATLIAPRKGWGDCTAALRGAPRAFSSSVFSCFWLIATGASARAAASQGPPARSTARHHRRRDGGATAPRCADQFAAAASTGCPVAVPSPQPLLCGVLPPPRHPRARGTPLLREVPRGPPQSEPNCIERFRASGQPELSHPALLELFARDAPGSALLFG